MLWRQSTVINSTKDEAGYCSKYFGAGKYPETFMRDDVITGKDIYMINNYKQHRKSMNEVNAQIPLFCIFIVSICRCNSDQSSTERFAVTLFSSPANGACSSPSFFRVDSNLLPLLTWKYSAYGNSASGTALPPLKTRN